MRGYTNVLGDFVIVQTAFMQFPDSGGDGFAHWRAQ
jgi:hypothetical protein